MSGGPGNSERYLRMQATIYNRDEMAEICALVIGVGAVGNEVIKHLALLGIGRILLLDFDLFESHNLSRSVLFASAPPGLQQPGQPKVQLAAEVLKIWNPDVAVTALPYRVEEVDLGPFLQADLVFSCVDTLAARVYIAIQAARASVPLLEGGMDPEDPERFEVVATDSGHGPCGSMCLHPKLKALAKSDILPSQFYAHEGCGVIRGSLGEGQSVPTLSMTSSILAAEEVVLGLRLHRDRRKGRVRPRGSRLSMTVRASGEQRFMHTFFPACDEDDCPLQIARAAGQPALAARSQPVHWVQGTSECLTLEDILVHGARTLELEASEVEVWVDQGFTPGFHCTSCGQVWHEAALLTRAHGSLSCCSSPSPQIRSHRSVYNHDQEEEVRRCVSATAISAMGFRPYPGFIVRAIGEHGPSSAVRLVLDEPYRGGSHR